MKLNKLFTSAALLLHFNCLFADVPYMQCFNEASARYGLPAEIMIAVAKVESKYRNIISKPNKNKTYDIGIMQVNSSWLPELKKYNITQDDLVNKPCQNIMVGTWILAQKIKAYGFNWKAIQRYNGSDPALGYAQKVFQVLQEQNPHLVQNNQINFNVSTSPKLATPTTKLPEIVVNNQQPATTNNSTQNSTQKAPKFLYKSIENVDSSAPINDLNR